MRTRVAPVAVFGYRCGPATRGLAHLFNPRTESFDRLNRHTDRLSPFVSFGTLATRAEEDSPTKSEFVFTIRFLSQKVCRTVLGLAPPENRTCFNDKQGKVPAPVFQLQVFPSRSRRSSARSFRSASNVGGGSEAARWSASSGETSARGCPVPRKTGNDCLRAIISRRVRPLGESGHRSACGVHVKNSGTTCCMYFQYPGLSVCSTNRPPGISDRWTSARNSGVISRR